ncbi:MAG: agmatinase [Ruminococcus flavefaciens]|nr:agmatinase [Ruminococcus flavefaciens]MCM1360890.1 agmatinase [Clostridiales bacterium]MCM1435566.1 agmatinase [Ruminococcus flavefaciens]
MLNKNIQTFIACDSEYDDAKIVLFGAGFDGTTSFRPGTRFAPAAIRNESFGIETYSPYQDKDMLDYSYFDSGDLELPFGSTNRAVADIAMRADMILTDGKIPFMIGGEHLVTLGSVMAVTEKFEELYIVHFDAHADLRDDYLGQKLSHACVLRRCHELVGDGHIFQFGIRSGDREEFLFANEHTEMHKFNFDGLEETVEKLKGKNVYLTVDLDVLDPSIFPGTGTPEAGGVSFDELRRALTLVCSKLNIVACDVNELSPVYDQSGVSTAVACKIIREMLLAMS